MKVTLESPCDHGASRAGSQGWSVTVKWWKVAPPSKDWAIITSTSGVPGFGPNS